MKKWSFLASWLRVWVCSLVLSQLEAQIFINELDTDSPTNGVFPGGTNDDGEFVELYNAGSEAASLDGMVLVFYNGSTDTVYGVKVDDGTTAGRTVTAIDLSGLNIAPQGFLVIGGPAIGVSAVRLKANQIQNGGSSASEADAVALMRGAVSDFPAGAALPMDLETRVIDALVYNKVANSNDTGLAPLQRRGEPQLNEANGNQAPVRSLARVPDGSSTFETKTPTAGASNVISEALSLELSALMISESALPTTTTLTITRSGPTTQAITVSLALDDPSEVSGPATVVLGVGASSQTIELTSVNDAWADGDQIVRLRATHPLYLPAEIVLTVNDDGDVDQLRINEIFATGIGDANGDTYNSATSDRARDRFVEIINLSPNPIDLSQHTLWDRDQTTPRHIFPVGTVLSAGRALVVFGGGPDEMEGIHSSFGQSWVQRATAGTLSLTTSATEEISLRRADGVEVAAHRFAAEGSSTDALTRDPDVTGEFTRHQRLASGLAFSPGRKNDNTLFANPITDTLAVSLSATSVSENAPAGAVELIIDRPAGAVGEMAIVLHQTRPNEARLRTLTAHMSPTENRVRVPIDVINDVRVDATQTVVFSATTAGYLTGRASLNVTDDGDQPLTALFINEIDCDQPSTDTAEFIELYDGGLGNRSLDGWVVAFFNGSDSRVVRSLDLTGYQTDALGFFVIGSAAVPEVDYVIETNSWLQNGPDAVAVYRTEASNLVVGTVASANGLVDALVYGTNDAPATDLLSVLTPQGEQANEGPDNNANALAQVPDATAAFQTTRFRSQAPTPGRSNNPALSAYQTWAATYPGLGAPTDDTDLDGLTNLLEYALGQDPLRTSTTTPLLVIKEPDGRINIRVVKGSAAGNDPQLQWKIQSSPDLSSNSWNEETGLTITNDATQFSIYVNPGTATRFYRLLVNLASGP